MSVQEIIEAARQLTRAELNQLKDALDMLPGVDEARKSYRLTDLRGLGKEIWEGVDVSEYLNTLRDEWDRDR